ILTHGPCCHEFEETFSTFMAGGHSVTTSSCTAAMHLFYMHLGVGPGDEVILPAISHVATAHALEITGARPVFVDCGADTGTMDPDLLERAVTPATRALCLVHFNGIPADMTRITAVAAKHDLKVLEDCATALGACWDGTHVGLFGDGAAFSFYPAKHITAGEGGMFCSRHAEVAVSVRGRRAFCYDRSLNERGLPGIYDVDGLGLNYRMSEMQAALGLSQLRRIRRILEIRARNAAALEGRLGGIEGVRLMESRDRRGTDGHYCLTVMLDGDLAARRDDMLAQLKEEDIGTSVRQPDGSYLIDPDGPGPAPEFTVSDRSFNLRSLLGNAVLRWEWSPGSTLFLVWQQSRAGRLQASEFDEMGALDIGNFDLGFDTRELFGLRSDNIFLVKVNYWLNF
ncbi:MAG: DegT/DnrJ/EryC1/StrS family aminotransferase, partial [Gemmatimonadetes bacterium]|nr:DegT/DnrJ/EryC1/StrS family aminotransferase [Gemmatimonadota bacterium]